MFFLVVYSLAKAFDGGAGFLGFNTGISVDTLRGRNAQRKADGETLSFGHGGEFFDFLNDPEVRAAEAGAGGACLINFKFFFHQ